MNYVQSFTLAPRSGPEVPLANSTLLMYILGQQPWSENNRWIKLLLLSANAGPPMNCLRTLAYFILLSFEKKKRKH